MTRRLQRILWLSGWPARTALVWSIKLYRNTLGTVIGGGCRFFPSCSAYAERAVAETGAIRGVALAAWRVIRCSPLSAGGVDYPPARGRLYDADIRAHRSQMAEAGS